MKIKSKTKPSALMALILTIAAVSNPVPEGLAADDAMIKIKNASANLFKDDEAVIKDMRDILETKSLSAKGIHISSALLMCALESKGRTSDAEDVGSRLYRSAPTAFISLSNISESSDIPALNSLREALKITPIYAGKKFGCAFLYNNSSRTIKLMVSSPGDNKTEPDTRKSWVEVSGTLKTGSTTLSSKGAKIAPGINYSAEWLHIPAKSGVLLTDPLNKKAGQDGILGALLQLAFPRCGMAFLAHILDSKCEDAILLSENGFQPELDYFRLHLPKISYRGNILEEVYLVDWKK